MRDRGRAVGWVVAYAALVLAPLAVALSVPPAARSARWSVEAASALGFVAFTVLAVQLALVSRIRRLSRAFGLDVLMEFHREMAIVALAAVVLHPLLLVRDAAIGWRAWAPWNGPWPLAAGAVALWLAVAIVGTSLARRRLRLGYEAWQVVHVGATVLVTLAALAHALGMGRHAGAARMRWTLAAYAALFLGLLLRYRLVRPLQLRRRPWELVANDDAGGDTRLLTVRPVGHAGFPFAPGQFAWLMTGRSPLFSQQHPLSIASAPAREPGGGLQFAVKALGDWSGGVVPALRPGHRVWIDGPYGAFTPTAGSWPLVLIAGGIGIAPMRSILLSTPSPARRRIVLFHAAARWTRVSLRAELETLARRLPFALVWVFERPEEGWTGERGFVTPEMLRRHVPEPLADAEYFVCGPLAMIDAVERMCAPLGIPARRMHTERFQMV